MRPSPFIQLSRYRSALSLGYLACLGGLCVLAVGFYFQLPSSPSLFLICTTLILGIYLLNRVSDAKEDFSNDASRQIFYERRGLYLMCSIALIGATLAALIATMHFHWIFPLLVGLGICYSYPLLPYFKGMRLEFKRLKDIFLFKNLAVALLWGTCPVMVPLVYAGKSHASGIAWMLSGALTVSTFVNTLFDDILDEPGDRLAGISTLPVLLGARKCYGILLLVSLVWLGLVFGFHHRGFIEWRHVAFFAALVFYPLVYMSLHWITPQRKLLVDLASESDLLLFGAGLIGMGVIGG